MAIDSGQGFCEVNDADLIIKVRNGCRKSEERLYLRYKGLALTVAYRHADTPTEAEDIVSESFLRVFESLRRGVGPDEFFRAYLLTVVSREAFARNKVASMHVVTDDVREYEPKDLHTDEVLQRAEATFAISAFKSLPERWRTVLWHTEVEGMRPIDIAPMLGLTPNAVSTLAARAREGLREAYLATHLNKQVALPSTCAEARKLLPAIIRGNACKRNYRFAKTHLAGCDDCSAVYGELSRVGTKLADVLPLVAGSTTVLGPSASGCVPSGSVATARPVAVHSTGSGSAPAAAPAAATSLGQVSSWARR